MKEFSEFLATLNGDEMAHNVNRCVAQSIMEIKDPSKVFNTNISSLIINYNLELLERYHKWLHDD